MTLPARLRLLRLLRRWPLRMAALLLLAGAGWLWWSQPKPEDPAQLLAMQPTAAGPAAVPPSTAASEPLGWPLDAEGRLEPHRLLRERFDQLLAQGPAAAREQLAQQARAELNAEQQATVLRLWDRYLALQQRDWQIEVDLNRPETWNDALSERHRVRHEQLGSAWAEAFFGTDEERVRAFLAAQSGSQPSTSPSPPP